jgi:hypothetical protein
MDRTICNVYSSFFGEMIEYERLDGKWEWAWRSPIIFKADLRTANLPEMFY